MKSEETPVARYSNGMTDYSMQSCDCSNPVSSAWNVHFVVLSGGAGSNAVQRKLPMGTHAAVLLASCEGHKIIPTLCSPLLHAISGVARPLLGGRSVAMVTDM